MQGLPGFFFPEKMILISLVFSPSGSVDEKAGLAPRMNKAASNSKSKAGGKKNKR